MFRKFELEDVSAQSKVKSSTQRAIKRKVAEQYEPLEPYLDDIIPKGTLQEARCKDKLSIYVVDGEALFFQHRNDPIYPTLKLLHKYPFFMPSLQVDKGAIKFIFSGADIMCPGLTSKGGKCDTDVPEGTPVAIFAEGKELPLAIGVTTMSTEDIREKNKGIGVEIVHRLDDGLWRIKRFD